MYAASAADPVRAMRCPVIVLYVGMFINPDCTFFTFCADTA